MPWVVWTYVPYHRPAAPLANGRNSCCGIQPVGEQGAVVGAAYRVRQEQPIARLDRATGSRDGGAGEGRSDEATQYRPVALEIAFAIF